MLGAQFLYFLYKFIKFSSENGGERTDSEIGDRLFNDGLLSTSISNPSLTQNHYYAAKEIQDDVCNFLTSTTQPKKPKVKIF